VKHCRKDAVEPECLASFRAANPAADWEKDFRSNGRSCYEALRATLRQSQTGLCAYCEVRVVPANREPPNEQIAHFHPKRDKATTHNWALDWRNLWLACMGGTRWTDRTGPTDGIRWNLPENLSCDEATRDEVLDGAVLRPDEIPAFPRLFRFKQWSNRLDIAPDERACMAAGIPVRRVEITIEKLNLNCPRLASARLTLHAELVRARKRLSSSGLDPLPQLRKLAERLLAPSEDGHRRAFFSVARWSLGQAAEDYLQASGFDG
jgi:uncharacterized protein (TIGR02646 family)